MSRIHLSQIACTSAIACTIFTLTACSGSDIAFQFKSEEEQYAILYDSPRFWEDTISVGSTDGLYQIENVAFEGKPYNRISNFGNSILMVGQGIYSSHLMESITDAEPEYEYSFEVYDPWRNRITAKLSRESISCDSYQILSDKLFLYDSEENIINVYNTDLKQIDTIACPESGEISYYSGYNSEVILSIADNQLTILSANDFSQTTADIPMYSTALCDVSTDGNYFLVSGVDRNSLQNVISVFDTSTNEAVTYLQGDDFSASDLSENSFVTRMDTENNVWVYHTFDNQDIYFSQADIQDAQIINDENILLHAEKSVFSDTGEHSTYYYIFSPSDGIVSSFSYNCGVYGSQQYQTFSPDYAYMEQCNCVFFLVYTAECMPKLLAWNLDEANNTTNFTLNSYSTISDTLTAVAAGTANSIDNPRTIASDYPDDFGSEVTMISNISEYDWGELASINERATELEDKYNIEIYLGPEVPASLDYYNMKQNDDTSTLSESLGSLERIFDCYPTDFFTQLCFGTNQGIRLYLTGDITGNYSGTISEASGFVTNINNYIVIVLDANYSWNWDYTVNHEIAHLIDRRLDFRAAYNENSTYSYDKWCSFNPEDFSYLESYDGYENNPDYNKYSKYFIDSYGTTYSTEDRAEIFGTIMDNVLSGITEDSTFSSGTILNDKMKYYCECIRDGFNTEDWPETLPWEVMFK